MMKNDLEKNHGTYYLLLESGFLCSKNLKICNKICAKKNLKICAKNGQFCKKNLKICAKKIYKFMDFI